jgi:hypothetical protein
MKMTEEKREDKPENEKKFNYLVIILLNIVLTTASLFVYHNYILKPQQSRSIVGIDIKGFLEKQKSGLVSGKISEEQFKANMDKFEAMVNDLGKRKVVLMSDVILRGAEIIDLSQ